MIESAELLDTVAAELKRINQKLGTDIIFKSSFDKANRTSIRSFRGPGLEKGLQMLSDIREKYGLRVLTDIHESWQAEAAGQVCDVLQIPAASSAVRPTFWWLPHAQDGRSTSRKRSS